MSTPAEALEQLRRDWRALPDRRGEIEQVAHVVQLVDEGFRAKAVTGPVSVRWDDEMRGVVIEDDDTRITVLGALPVGGPA